MSTTSNKDGDSPAPKPSRQQVIFMLTTMLDTTWRMFVPTLGLCAVGAWVGRMYGMESWLAIVGIAVGAIISGFLVRQQLQRVKK